MKRLYTAVLTLCVSASLVGCSNMTKQDVGTLSGGVAGGLIGSTIGGGSGEIVAIAAGTLAGAFIGGSIGKSMDDTDRMKMNQALDNQAVGQPAYWNNQRTGTQYQMVPTRNVTVGGNPYCREYRTTADIGGRKQQVYGTACRQPDGSWKSVN